MTKRDKDIHARFEKAYAERSMYDKGSEHYIALSEVITLILGEYGKKYENNRYSFRLWNGRYGTVVLDKDEAF